ncbi:8705_t:CDS:10, partial [Scutellospora calospora]
MVSRIFGGNPFEELVEKATSELNPIGQDNLALNLDISDQIRSKSVQPREALRVLKKRIMHTNPNVQLLALNLTDTCIKNGGHHFLVEVASRDFVDTLVSIIKSSNSNPEVIQKLLGLIQTWSSAFDGRPELKYVTEIYYSLKHEGYIFPKIDKAPTVMIDTATPPEWTDSEVCVRCRVPFTMINRKHHCRNCGHTYCGECSAKTTSLPHYGINEPVRVCDTCYMKKQQKDKGVDLSSFKSYSALTQPTLYSNSISTSVNEAEYNRNYVQPALQKSAKKVEPVKQVVVKQEVVKQEEEEMDEDLAAAIQASLQEMQISKTQKSPAYNAENIYNYSETLERIRQSGGDLMRDRQIQELHERVGELKPKLTKSLTETIQKHQDLLDMHEKLSQAVKLYDRLLDERFSNSSRRISTISYSIPQRAASSGISGVGNIYPSVASPNQTSNIYSHVPAYPVASAPATSPSYVAAQT